jgi:hypothetical protein
MVSLEAVLVAGLPEHGTGHASDHKLLARAHPDLHATYVIEGLRRKFAAGARR